MLNISQNLSIHIYMQDTTPVHTRGGYKAPIFEGWWNIKQKNYVQAHLLKRIWTFIWYNFIFSGLRNRPFEILFNAILFETDLSVLSCFVYYLLSCHLCLDFSFIF